MLIVYGTRYGATTGAASEITKVLRDEGFDFRVVSAKEKEVHDISECELIIVWSGLKIDRWTKGLESLLKKFRKSWRRRLRSLFRLAYRQCVCRRGTRDWESYRKRIEELAHKTLSIKYNARMHY